MSYVFDGVNQSTNYWIIKTIIKTIETMLSNEKMWVKCDSNVRLNSTQNPKHISNDKKCGKTHMTSIDNIRGLHRSMASNGI